MTRESTKDVPYTADEALEVLIESALQWRKQTRQRQQAKRIPFTDTRSAWLSEFVVWLGEREDITAMLSDERTGAAPPT